MSISRLLWRVALTLGAAGAALVALAVPASAERAMNPEMAGYIATGAQVKDITATVYLRNPAQYAGEVASYRHSVQLWSADLVVTVGVRASTSGKGYTAYATIYDRSTRQVIASNPNAVWCLGSNVGCGTEAGSWPFGDTFRLRIGYWPPTSKLHMYVWTNEHHYSFQSAYTVPPQSFRRAQLGTEFGSSPWDGSYSYTAPAASVKVAAYNGAQLTTYRGNTKTLSSWYSHAKLVAQPPGSALVAEPADLSSGGASFQTWFAPKSAQ